MLPNVNIVILNGGLGQVPTTADGTAGLIMTGVAVAGKIAINEPKQIFGIEGAKALGLTPAYDTANDLRVYREISEFYATAGNGKELWILLSDEDDLMTEVLDVTNDLATKLIDASNRTIRILGVCRKPPADYTFTASGGLDPDVASALIKGQALAEQYTTAIAPLRVLIAGRGWTGVAAALTDLKQNDKNRCAVVLAATDATDYEPAVGLTLGRLAAIPVQRKISRKKDSSLPILQGYLADGKTVEEHDADLNSIHDKGYIVLRKYPSTAGYYFSGDPTATSSTDDYNTLSRGRVIDKALVITYLVYLEELDDEVLIEASGALNPAYVKSLQGSIENAININMTAKGEISSVSASIDPSQNILVTNQLDIDLAITPVGYSSVINVKIGFKNPNNA